MRRRRRWLLRPLLRERRQDRTPKRDAQLALLPIALRLVVEARRLHSGDLWDCGVDCRLEFLSAAKLLLLHVHVHLEHVEGVLDCVDEGRVGRQVVHLDVVVRTQRLDRAVENLGVVDLGVVKDDL